MGTIQNSLHHIWMIWMLELTPIASGKNTPEVEYGVSQINHRDDHMNRPEKQAHLPSF